jgi:hypothetical protein
VCKRLISFFPLYSIVKTIFLIKSFFFCHFDLRSCFHWSCIIKPALIITNTCTTLCFIRLIFHFYRDKYSVQCTEIQHFIPFVHSVHSYVGFLYLLLTWFVTLYFVWAVFLQWWHTSLCNKTVLIPISFSSVHWLFLFISFSFLFPCIVHLVALELQHTHLCVLELSHSEECCLRLLRNSITISRSCLSAFLVLVCM